MLEGIHVLNKEVIMTIKMPDAVVMIIVGLVISGIGLFIGAKKGEESAKWFCTALILFIGGFFTFLFGVTCPPETESGRYRYEVTVGDYVMFTDIYEKYDVIERRGEIWVLEDKDE